MLWFLCRVRQRSWPRPLTASCGADKSFLNLSYREGAGSVPSGYGGDVISTAGLESKGLIKILGKDGNGYPIFDFTVEGEKYTTPLPSGKPKDKRLLISQVNLNNLEVTGLTVPSEGSGQKIVKADFTEHIDYTPFGEIAEGTMVQRQIDSRSVFVLYEDGWHLDKLYDRN